MITRMDKTLWTPAYGLCCDFEVYLDSDFAREMLNRRIISEQRIGMNRASGLILQHLNFSERHPYTFYGNSALVQNISLGHDGKWLSADEQDIKDRFNGEKKPLVYHSHNLESFKETFALHSLFGKYVEYEELLK